MPSIKYKILHISDLHFGSLNQNLWALVCRRVNNQYKPNIIIISGDIIDCPLFKYKKFKTAKEEILKLAEKCKAEIFLAPGNHDVAIYGILSFRNITRRGFDKWFRKNLDGEKKIVTSIDDKEVVEVLNKFKQLIVPFDSTRRLFISSGKVLEQEIEKLDDFMDEVRDNESIYGQRIAVVHHHPLPVPHSEHDHWREPFLVFKNAGSFLLEIYKKYFNMILHGHKHHTNYSRINFETDQLEDRLLTVLAAGSATKGTGLNQRSNYNLISIYDNGEVLIRQFYIGSGKTLESKKIWLYKDQTERKKAIFSRSFELQGFGCDELYKKITIDEIGTSEVIYKCKGVRKKRIDFEKDNRPIYIEVDSGKILYCRLLKLSEDAGHKLIIEQQKSNYRKKEGCIKFEQLSTGGTLTDYGFQFKTHSCHAMNKQEYTRFKKGDKFEEFTGIRMTIPCKDLKLRLNFPQKFSEYLEKDPPILKIFFDEDLMNSRRDKFGELIESSDVSAWKHDKEMTEFEKDNLRRIDQGKYELVIEKPLIGYCYKIIWNLPDELEFLNDSERNKYSEIKNQVNFIQDSLISFRKLRVSDLDSNSVKVIKTLIQYLHEKLATEYRSFGSEIFTTSIMTYDKDSNLLKMIEGFKTEGKKTDSMDIDWELEPGMGNAGFSYKIGKSIFYKDDLVEEDNKYFLPIKGALDYKFLLSVSLFTSEIEEFISTHDWQSYSIMNPIAILNVGSTSSSSKLGLLKKKEIQEITDIGNKTLELVIDEMTH